MVTGPYRGECCKSGSMGQQDALLITIQLISVISLLSQDSPDLNSPANVDAAKEVREDFAST
jgi:ubiquitin-protein ligase